MGSEQNLTEDDGSARLADLAAAMMTQTVPECTSHRESPLFAADRGAYWESLRSLGPVVKVAGANVYYLTRRDDILQAARDPYTFSSSWPALPVVNASGDPLPRVPYRARRASTCGTRGSCIGCSPQACSLPTSTLSGSGPKC